MLFKIIKKLIGIGEADSCLHDYDKWEVIKVVTDQTGSMNIQQKRVCKKCGYTQFNMQHSH